MLNNPDSHLKDQMKYFIAPDDGHEDFIRISSPEDISFCDPACGSGHILSYAFELLYAMYEERGYRPSEIPELILEKNLTGFEIDERAAQIASLVLAMRAREHDRRFLKRDVTARIHVFKSVDCEGADLPKSVSEQLEHLGEIGSLVKLTEKDLDSIHTLAQEAGASLLDNKLAESLGAIEPALNALSGCYDVVVANPPYMGSSSFNPFMSKWIKKNYPDVKSDLFSCFILRIMDFAQDHAEAGIMCPFVWMFIGSYEKLRNKMIDEKTITSLIQLEYSGFAGATVPICTFTFHNEHIPGYKGGYVRLSDFVGPDNQAPKALEAISNPTCGWFYRADASTFHDIPGTPIAYWARKGITNAFVSGCPLGEITETHLGMATCDNNRFLRLWWEPSCSYRALPDKYPYKWDQIRWVPYNKGGIFRRWAGNDEYVVDWKDSGNYIAEFGAVMVKEDLRFKQMTTWTRVSSGLLASRYKAPGYMFDMTGPAAFGSRNGLLHDLAFLNSSVARLIASFMSASLDFQPGQIGQYPILPLLSYEERVLTLAETCISVSQDDWDTQETSWNFKCNPLV